MCFTRRTAFAWRSAGHTVQGDNPKDLVAELRRFLSSNN
jgi:hypothetical protein